MVAIDRFRERLDLLLSEAGYQSVSSSEQHLDFENREKEILIRMGVDVSRANEFVFFIVRRGTEFSIDDLIEFYGVDRKDIPISASNEEVVSVLLDFLTNLLMYDNQTLLRGDESAYKKLEVIGNRRAEDYEARIKMDRLLVAAEKAWVVKDYKEVTYLLSSHTHLLPRYWKDRLKYAAKHMN